MALVPRTGGVRLPLSGRELLVGFDGEVYLEDVTAEPALEAVVRGITCRYELPVLTQAAGARNGRGTPLACGEATP